jgi:hypothetical protein
MARPLQSKVNSLSWLDLQVDTNVFHDQFRFAGVARNNAGRRRVRFGDAILHCYLFRVFPVDAVLHDSRQDEAGT